MVTVLLSGGLGNQMFQYAAAKALAKRLDASLAFDLYPLIKNTRATIRSYELGIFNIDAPVKSTVRGKFLVKAHPFVQKHRSFFQQLGFFTDTYAILYQPVFDTMKGDIIMSGYFQNERYFEAIKDDLRKNFTFKYPLDEKNRTLTKEVSSTESVAVHIRRGDYVTNKDSVSNFVTCDKSYYEQSIRLISEKVKNPAFYVFSEEIDWVKENLNFEDSTVVFVDWNRGKDSYRDMQLMSLCKHNIIANSSFSWWGAWLNANKEKVVIAPSQWFREEKKNALLDDFFPKGWTKI